MINSFKRAGTTALAVVFVALALLPAPEAFAEKTGEYTAKFKKDGQMIRPAGWREWVFVGSPVTPNSLNAGAAPFPEFHSVYIDPQSWAHWKKTGKFREGTMFAKELTSVGATKATSGKGFFNGELIGFEISHKDSKRYSKEAGKDERVVATSSVLVESKFLHCGSRVGHIEDVVVDKEVRGSGLGQKIVQHCIDHARNSGCYKVQLNCSNKNVPFYINNGMYVNEQSMRIDL